MELSREPGVGLVTDTLVGAVVHIYEEGLPVGRQRIGIYGIAMILGSDEALGATHTLNGLVVTAVTVLQLVCLGTGGTSQQLVTQADTHQGLHFLIAEELADMLYRLGALLGVARTVGKEQSVKLQLIEIVIPRYTNHLYASVQQAADDVGLHAAIYKHYALE